MTAVVQRHEALRTTFREVDGRVSQRIESGGSIAVPMERVEGADGVDEIARAELARPFDLEAGPLLRATLLRLGAEEHVLLVVMHHIVCDGWSMGVFARELGALYEGSPLPPLEIQYADFASWQRAAG